VALIDNDETPIELELELLHAAVAQVQRAASTHESLRLLGRI
jgi:hypothetical protein